MLIVFKKPCANPGVTHRHGITLIETMLILMLLVIMTCAIIPFIFYSQQKPQQQAAENQDILLIKNALNFYKLDNGFYPTTMQGLNALIKKPKTAPVPQHWVPYLSALPVDSWGRPYQYKNTNNGANIELFSCGPPQKKKPNSTQGCPN